MAFCPLSTLVVIPAYREAPRVAAVVRQVRAAQPGMDVPVVDDGSPDETSSVARRAGAIVVRHPINLGYGCALHTGYHYAQRHGHGRVLQMDADGQHDATMLQRLVDALDQGADVALGSRYLHGEPPRTSLLRKLGTRLFAAIASFGTGCRITDPTSGFQGLSSRALAAVRHDGYPEDYPDTDVLIEFARQGLRLREVPVVMHERQGGLSMHRGLKVAFYAFKMAMTLLLLPIRRRTPTRAQDSVNGRFA